MKILQELQKLPFTSVLEITLNVNRVCPVCPVCPICPVCPGCPICLVCPVSVPSVPSLSCLCPVSVPSLSGLCPVSCVAWPWFTPFPIRKNKQGHFHWGNLFVQHILTTHFEYSYWTGRLTQRESKMSAAALGKRARKARETVCPVCPVSHLI